MSAKRWVSLLVVLILFSSLSLAKTVHAATTPILPELISLTVPAEVTAGTPLTVRATANFDTKVGMWRAFVHLTGPSKQLILLALNPVGGELQGILSTNQYMEPGSWTVSDLTLVDNNNRDMYYAADKTPTFKYAVKVKPAAGKDADTKVPVLKAISVTEEAQTGDPVIITATVTDDVSGVYYVDATVGSNAEDEFTGRKNAGIVTVSLKPTGKENEYKGTYLMDNTISPDGKVRIISVFLKDNAGNRVVLKDKDLADNKGYKLVTAGRSRSVPKGLLTSPYLNLIYPGEMTYDRWIVKDLDYVLSLLDNIKTDPAAVREAIAGELPQLKAALDGVRTEIYVDPVTKLKVSPFATTGKWMALDRAISARFDILLEMERRDGLLFDKMLELTHDSLASGYLASIGKNDEWLPLEGSSAERYSQQAAAYLAVLAQSPEAVKILQAPAAEGWILTAHDNLDRDVLYFTPILTPGRNSLTWGTGRIMVPVSTEWHLSQMVQQFFMEIGHHFGEAYVSSLESDLFLSKYGPYMQLRGNQSWAPGQGYLSQPWYNISVDFFSAYTPLGLTTDVGMPQAYPDMTENPTQMTAFKQFVEQRLQKTPPAVTIAPANYNEIDHKQIFQASITSSASPVRLASYGFAFSKNRQTTNIQPSFNGATSQFASSDTAVGRVTMYSLSAQDSDGRDYQRWIFYYRAPVMLDPVKPATTKPSVAVSGRTQPNTSVSADGQTAVANSEGKFSMDVPLTKGTNTIKVSVPGTAQAASVKVLYEPEGTPVPIKLTLPSATNKTFAIGSGETVPYATVSVGGIKVQADAKGKFVLFVPLKEGTNKVEVVATTPAGNQGTWKAVVLVDTTPPALTVSAPLQTNMEVYKVTGTVERGAILSMNETVLAPDANGKFEVEVSLVADKPEELAFTATDAAGNKSTQTVNISYAKAIDTVTGEFRVTLNGKVEPGSTLSYDGYDVTVSGDGRFSLNVKSPVGRNIYTINVTGKDGKPAGFLQFQVIHPFLVYLPTVDGDQVTITGKSVPGYIVMVDGQPATVDAEGRFKATITKDGRTSVEVLVDGDGKQYKEKVTLP